MATRLIALTLFIMGCITAASARNAAWSEYRDAVYDCRLEYPTALFEQDDFDAAQKFQRFSGRNAQTYFRVMGIDNKDKLTAQNIRKKYLTAQVDGDVVYQRAKSGFLVLSGFRGNTIFYTRVALSRDQRRICILEVTYPRRDKAAFDDAVKRMSHSFIAGDPDSTRP